MTIKATDNVVLVKVLTTVPLHSFSKSVNLVQVLNKMLLCWESDPSDVLGLLVMADQVMYMVYREMREAWSRPELG